MWIPAIAVTVLAVTAVALGWPYPRFGATHILVSLTGPGLGILGAIIASRHPQNPIGWLFVGAGILLVVADVTHGYASRALLEGWGLPAVAVADWLTHWVFAPGLLLGAFAVLVFPDGRLPSSRWRWFAWFATGWGSLIVGVAVARTWPYRGRILVEEHSDIAGGFLEYLPLSLLPIGIGVVVALVSRYRRSRGDVRLQIKWFMYAASLFLLGVVFLAVEVVPTVVAELVHNVGILAMPAAVAVAILRYRLYAIDRIISRTVSYGIVVAVLGAVYAAAVVGFGAAVSGFTGAEDSDLVVAVSVLAVVALFQPVRSRAQRAVDRRFNRSGYKARLAVEAFAHAARDEVELERIERRIAETAAVAVQPTTVSLWLCSTGGAR